MKPLLEEAVVCGSRLVGSFGGSMIKIIPYNNPKELEKYLNGGWQLVGTFMHQTKAVFILKK